jgi:hypothetical protein
MTKDEVLKLALEALGTAAHGLYKATPHFDTHKMIEQVEAAITAIKQTLVAPVQEPVAWRFDQAKYRENDLRGRQWAFNVFSQTKPYMDEMVQNVTPLYTTQPAAQRQWVGLTDEEIVQGNKESWVTEQAWQSAVWWAEAKLKEKNT